MATNQEKFDQIHGWVRGLRTAILDHRIADPGFVKNVRRVRDFITNPGRNIWHEHTVSRGGHDVPAIQELADTKTLALENKATLAALTELITQMNTGQAVDYARIEAIQRQVLAEGVVSVDVNINQKVQP